MMCIKPGMVQFAAMRAGASGYLVKGAQQEEIVRAVRSVAAGQAIFGPTVARRIIDFFSSGSPAAATAEPFPELTGRERDVLDLIAAGRANTAIARQLAISTKTVSNHISAIFAKLQVAGRTEAIIRARSAGLLARPPDCAPSSTRGFGRLPPSQNSRPPDDKLDARPQLSCLMRDRLTVPLSSLSSSAWFDSPSLTSPLTVKLP